MFTYVQIIGSDTETFKGYVDYRFDKDKLSMTLVRGCRLLKHIVIPFSEVTELSVENYFGTDCASFFYGGKKYSFINTGYGEADYLKRHLLKVIH